MKDVRKTSRTPDGDISVAVEAPKKSSVKLNLNKNAIRPTTGFEQIRSTLGTLVNGINDTLVYDAVVLSSRIIPLGEVYVELGLDLFDQDLGQSSANTIEELKVYNRTLDICVSHPVIDDDRSAYDKYNVLSSIWTNHVGMDTGHITVYRDTSIDSAKDFSAANLQCNVMDTVNIKLSPTHRGKGTVINVVKKSGLKRKDILSMAFSNSPSNYFQTNNFSISLLPDATPGPDIFLRNSKISSKKMNEAKEQYKKLSAPEFIIRNLDSTGQDGMLMDGSLVAKHEGFYISLYLMLQHMVDYTSLPPPDSLMYAPPRIVNYGARMIAKHIGYNDEKIVKIRNNLGDIKDFDGTPMLQKFRGEPFKANTPGLEASGLVFVPTQEQIAHKWRVKVAPRGYHNPQKWDEGIAIDIRFATFGCGGFSNNNCRINEFITKFAWQYGFGREYSSAQGYAHLVYYLTSGATHATGTLFKTTDHVYKNAETGAIQSIGHTRLWASLVDDPNWVQKAEREFEQYYKQ